MKVSDYIVKTLIRLGITETFGYPGGNIAHILNSLDKYKDKIKSHLCYHEQAAALAACGYAQVAHKPCMVYATSGPGATNLITGIANAYFDSIPVLFITGQVNSKEIKKNSLTRQEGFQETDIVSMVKNITKYSVRIDSKYDILYYLENAIHIAVDGRQGPVLLDIPNDIQYSEIDEKEQRKADYISYSALNYKEVISSIERALNKSKRPCMLIGAGVQNINRDILVEWLNRIKIPTVTSMIAVDRIPNSYGFIGVDGNRAANYIVTKSDLIISLGSRFDLRQTGLNTKKFAPNAEVIQINIDLDFSKRGRIFKNLWKAELSGLLPGLSKIEIDNDYSDWIKICDTIKAKLSNFDSDNLMPNRIVKRLSELIDKDAIITTDVGQNQLWVAQSFIPNNRRILFSGGHGAMGYSLPAAIGAYYGADKKKKIISFNGDGGLQMNIQELQFIAREKIPVKIILLNNSALGMIRSFQKLYLNSNYVQTEIGKGYENPNFGAIAKAYGLNYCCIDSENEIDKCGSYLNDNLSSFIEIKLNEFTNVFPKLKFGNSLPYQEPELTDELYNYLETL